MLNGGADGDILALLDPAFLKGFGSGGGRMLDGTGSDTCASMARASASISAPSRTRAWRGIERVDLASAARSRAVRPFALVVLLDLMCLSQKEK